MKSVVYGAEYLGEVAGKHRWSMPPAKYVETHKDGKKVNVYQGIRDDVFKDISDKAKREARKSLD